MADVGQEEARTTFFFLHNDAHPIQDFDAAEKKALTSGATKFFKEVNTSIAF